MINGSSLSSFISKWLIKLCWTAKYFWQRWCHSATDKKKKQKCHNSKIGKTSLPIMNEPHPLAIIPTALGVNDLQWTQELLFCQGLLSAATISLPSSLPKKQQTSDDKKLATSLVLCFLLFLFFNKLKRNIYILHAMSIPSILWKK